MAVSAGKRYVAPSGAELIITKGAEGRLSDGDTPLWLKEEAPPGHSDTSGRNEPVVALGKRYRSADGEVELLVIRPGVCDLRYEGEPMQLVQVRALPSAD